MVAGTTAILTGDNSPYLSLVFLAVYDIVFTIIGYLLFETVLHAE